MTTKEAGSDAAAEPDFGIPLNIISDDVYTPDELDDGSPNRELLSHHCVHNCDGSSCHLTVNYCL